LRHAVGGLDHNHVRFRMSGTDDPKAIPRAEVADLEDLATSVYQEHSSAGYVTDVLHFYPAGFVDHETASESAGGTSRRRSQSTRPSFPERSSEGGPVGMRDAVGP
jgi:hypothetical protein